MKNKRRKKKRKGKENYKEEKRKMEKRENRGITKTEGRRALWALDKNVPSGTSVTNYQSTLRNIPKERGSDLHPVAET
jgi:hypothetical protein